MTIPDIPPGNWQVQVSSFGFSSGFSSAERTVEIKAGETVRVEDVLYEAGALRWSVQDKSGKPLPGAACRLIPATADSMEVERNGQTDNGGLWVVRGLFPGPYTASATAPGHAPITQQITIQAHEALTLTSREP